MIFRSEQISLRPFEPEDAPDVEVYLNHPDLAGRRYIPDGLPDVVPLSMGQVAEVVRQWQQAERALHLAVVQVSKGEMVGHVSADWGWDPHNPSVSVVIDPTHQRQGYGSTALRLVLRYLFGRTPAHCVTAWIDGWNEAGLAFADHLGFRHAGQMRRVGLRDGHFYDLVVVDLLRREWKGRGGEGDVA
ncbi:MAG: GNAT family N-acetyltransferase [Anaerolineae bacterium]|nr:GNAT family N-acetyltransferase [Anaerolineae bacterium]